MSDHKLVIYSDFICPFCYIGKVNAERLQEQNPGLEIEWREFELHPEGQPDPNSPYLQKAEENVRYLANEFGIDMRADVLTNVTSDSRKALLGFEFAKEQDKAESYREEVFKAYWIDGLDISEDQVLREIAQNVDLDADQLLRAIHDGKYQDQLQQSIAEAHHAGITGVPTYVYGDYKTVGSQPVSQLQKMIHLQQEKDELEQNNQGLSCGPDGC